MGYKLKVLSPVHIGCGEQYNGLNFILDEGKIIIIELDTIVKLLGQKNSYKLVDWIEKNVNVIDQIDAQLKRAKREKNASEINRLNNDLRTKRKNFTLKKFFELNSTINLGDIKQHSIYSVTCKNNFSDESEFHTFIKQMYKPYIPGTEIKGAIRTAILYSAIIDRKDIQDSLIKAIKNMLSEPVQKNITYQDYINEVKNQKKPDLQKKSKLVKRVEKIELLLQNIVFNVKNDIKKSDAKYDILKFLQIGDSELISTDNLSVSYVEPFNISKRFKIFYEFLRPDTELMLTSFKLEDEKSKNVKTEKMNLSEDKKNIISSINTILKKCKRFSDDLLDEEINYYKNHCKTNIVEHLERIKEQNTINSPVLRIGKDEGYLSLTVGLAVKKFNKNLYENILIHTTKNKSYDSKHGGLFPKSRKMVYWDGQELTTGWVKLIPNTQFDTNTSIQKNNDLNKQNNNSPDISSLLALKAKFGGGKR